jgi:hypothetical protein
MKILRNSSIAVTCSVLASVAMVLSYTTDAIPIRWKGNTPCKNPSAQFVEDFGTTTGSLNYACAIAYFNPAGFKAFVAATPSHANAWVKENLSPLVPYLTDIPDRNIWSAITLNRDRGRSVEVAFISRPSAAADNGEAFGAAARTWIRSTGKAYIDFLESNSSRVPPYPASDAAITQ